MSSKNAKVKSKSKDNRSKETTIKGYKPKIQTGKWVFYDECEKPRKNAFGPHVTEWRDKISTLGRPYKEIAASKSCLPTIPTAASSSTSKKRNHIYTRYTESQHQRKDAIDRMEKMIQLRNATDNYDPHIGKIKSVTINIDKLSEDLVTLSGNSQGPSASLSDEKARTDNISKKQSMNSDELEAMIDIKRKNPYRAFAKPAWVSREGVKDKLMARKKKNKKEEETETTLTGLSSAAEQRLKEVVQEFCDSILDLGGDEDNIEPSVVNCLFTSGYDTTPAMSAPVSLVKNSELPPGLKEVMGMQHSAISQDSPRMDEIKSTKSAFEKKLKNDKNAYRYGAWYLNPKTWKRMKKNKPLNLKTIKWEKQLTDLDARKEEVAEELSSLHITSAFSEFTKTKEARLPEFVLEAERVYKERIEKEKQKAEAEQRAKLEYLLKNKWS